MSESGPQLESGGLKERATQAYRKFVGRGSTSPDDLDLSDPEVIEANKLFETWMQEEDARAQGDRRAEHEANLAKTTFYFDAGATDPAYLRHVLSMLAQDLANVDEESDEPMPDIAVKILEKMKAIDPTHLQDTVDELEQELARVDETSVKPDPQTAEVIRARIKSIKDALANEQK